MPAGLPDYFFPANLLIIFLLSRIENRRIVRPPGGLGYPNSPAGKPQAVNAAGYVCPKNFPAPN